MQCIIDLQSNKLYTYNQNQPWKSNQPLNHNQKNKKLFIIMINHNLNNLLLQKQNYMIC